MLPILVASAVGRRAFPAPARHQHAIRITWGKYLLYSAVSTLIFSGCKYPGQHLHMVNNV